MILKSAASFLKTEAVNEYGFPVDDDAPAPKTSSKPAPKPKQAVSEKPAPKPKQSFNDALQSFRDLVEKSVRNWSDRLAPRLKDTRLIVVKLEPGSKRVRVVVNEVDPSNPSNVYSGRVHAFVDKATGDIYKPAGWNAPAKHSRGNIYSDQNGAEAFSADGGFIRYL